MRLFIAVNFNDGIKEKIMDCIRRLRESSERGNFTLRENLHLTLVFLGEVPETRLGPVKRAMDRACSEDFGIHIGGLGRFKRNGGDIYFLGIDRNPALSALYGRLRAELIKEGFAVEDREYRPHLTLGREVVPRGGFVCSEFRVLPMRMDAGKISLMRSDRINGKLTYTEIYAKRLEEGT